MVVLYELLLEYLRKHQIRHSEVDLNWRNYHSKVIFILLIYPILTINIIAKNNTSVSFHGTTTDFTNYAPFVVLLCKILRKRVTLRKFGGNFDLYFEALNPIKKSLVKYAIKNSDCVFFETKHLVDKFKNLTQGVWFPNVRNVVVERKNNNYKKKFVFISHIKDTKGVNIILEATKYLPEDYKIHLFGPKQNYSSPNHLKEIFNKSYKKVLQPAEVLETMNQYDVLLLPTYHIGEGYPGVIIEAYSLGKPVISTNWRAISEIIINEKTGFLIEPNSVEELVEAIKKFNNANYNKLSDNAFNYFQEFDQGVVMNKILKYI